MTINRSGVEFAKRIFSDRLGAPYVYGGTWGPGLDQFGVGCDCSGLVTDVLSATLHNRDMIWGREGISTESYRYKALGGPQLIGGVFPLMHVGSPADIPPDAVMRIDLHHEGLGGPSSHMHCVLDGMVMESNGSHGTCTLPGGAIDPNSSYWNDFWYLAGPITEDMSPAAPDYYRILCDQFL